MDEQKVLLDTFVAKVKATAALCRGDLVQYDNYGETVYLLTAGEHGHLTAAATGESLAMKVITQVAHYCMNDHVTNVLIGSAIVPGYAETQLRAYLGEVLDRALPPTLGEVPYATKQMICTEIETIAKDTCLGKNSNVARILEREKRASKFSGIPRALDSHAPWLGKLLVELLKSKGR